MTHEAKSAPSVSVSYARKGNSTKFNALGMRPVQERGKEQMRTACGGRTAESWRAFTA